MDLIDRYLAAVGALLPAPDRADITAELRDVLMSRREEKAAELGRPLTRDEDGALLKAFGNPLVVAGRYGRQQYLIGPDLFPIYTFVLRIVLAAVALSALIAAGVQGFASPQAPGPSLHTFFDVVWDGGFAAIGTVTVIFAVLQRTSAGRRIMDAWDPRDLPRVRQRRRRQGWPDYVGAIVVQSLFMFWWVGLLPLWPAAIPLQEGGALQFAFAPALRDLYLPVLALSAGAIGVNALKLAGRETLSIALALDAALQLAVIAVAGLALRAGHWLVVTGAPAAVLAKVERGVEIGAQVTLVVVICTAAIRLVVSVWRLARQPRAALSATSRS